MRDWLLSSPFHQLLRKDKHQYAFCSPKLSLLSPDDLSLLSPDDIAPHVGAVTLKLSQRILHRDKGMSCTASRELYNQKKSSACRYRCNFIRSLVSTAYGLMVLFHLLALGEPFETERNSMVHLSLWGIKRATANGSQGAEVNYL